MNLFSKKNKNRKGKRDFSPYSSFQSAPEQWDSALSKTLSGGTAGMWGWCWMVQMGGFIISSEGKVVSVGLSKEGSCSLTLKDILKSLPQLSTLSSKHTEELPRFGATSQKLEQGRMKSEGAQKRGDAGESHALVNPTLKSSGWKTSKASKLHTK